MNTHCATTLEGGVFVVHDMTVKVTTTAQKNCGYFTQVSDAQLCFWSLVFTYRTINYCVVIVLYFVLAVIRKLAFLKIKM